MAARAPAAEEIRRVVLLANAEKKSALELLPELEALLSERVERVVLEPDVRSFCNRLAQGESPPAADLAVVLGGDGAILAAARAFRDAPVPILGINFGRIGFLAATPATRCREVLEGVLRGEGVLEPRMRLLCQRVSEKGEPVGVPAVALNDVYVQRGSHQGMVVASLSVETEWVTTYRADGLIVATPSGSTAYSLTAGGPILVPSMEAMVVTPICAQSLSTRPLVLPPASHLAIRLTQAGGMITLAVDGQDYSSLRQGDAVVIARHEVPYPLLVLPDLDPYRRLRERLGWSGGIPDEIFPSGGIDPSRGAPGDGTRL